MRWFVPLGFLSGIGLAALPAAGPAPLPFCRCPDVTLERYYDMAEIVFIGRARSIRSVSGAAPRVEVDFTPLFRPEGAFKGTLDRVVLATPSESTACGLQVEVGQDYVIFASRDTDLAGRAWFTTCSGSRPYRPAAELFLGISTRDVVARLFELTGQVSADRPPPFHTSPACWREPRVHHPGATPGEPPPIRMTRQPGPAPDAEGIVAPNRAYHAWPVADSAGLAILVDVERPTLLRIAIDRTAERPAPRWISEKLLFLRVTHGRIEFTDVIVDVELGRVVYAEPARDGTAAFAQYREACLGQCPCLAVPGSADSLPAPPRHEGRAGEVAALRRIGANARIHLDADWDGRVFAEAGGRRFNVSRLFGGTGRAEYHAIMRESVFVQGAWWLHVAIYRDNPCVAEDALPVHAGWVPAFSRAGYLVAGVSPGGC